MSQLKTKSRQINHKLLKSKHSRFLHNADTLSSRPRGPAKASHRQTNNLERVFVKDPETTLRACRESRASIPGRSFLLVLPSVRAALCSLLLMLGFFLTLLSSPSFGGGTRASPCSMPPWSRSCCTSPAWPLLPRSWRNLKPSQEVGANPDLIRV